jgi:hypothetical protein
MESLFHLFSSFDFVHDIVECPIKYFSLIFVLLEDVRYCTMSTIFTRMNNTIHRSYLATVRYITFSSIRAKIQARSDEMYGEYVGRQYGRQARRFLTHYYAHIILTLGVLVLVWILFDDFKIFQRIVSSFLNRAVGDTSFSGTRRRLF